MRYPATAIVLPWLELVLGSFLIIGFWMPGTADVIYMKTDSKIRPEIQIYVVGNIIDRNQKIKK